MTQDTSALFQPLTIRKTTFKNRFCVGPLTIPTVFGSFGEFSPDGLDYFEARARGGFGLIFTGAMHPDALVDPVHPLDHKRPMKAPGAFKRSAVDLLERMDAYGARMIPQVSMGYGRNSPGCFCPSEIPYYHDPSRLAPALTRDQIRTKIDQMIDTAAFLKGCGFPGIEVHAMHWGYLLDQFAMAYMNHRTDEYGGDLENRLRCAREIVEGVKAACGADFIVSMRLALKSYIKGYNTPSLHGEEEVGRTLEEGLTIAQRLEAYGYDCLSVDFGQYDSFYYAAPPCYMEKGRIIDLAARAKEAVAIPILCGGRMNDPDLAAKAVAEGKIDGVVLGRASLADPDFPRKVEMGCADDIRPCIGCNQGCIGALKLGRRTGCAVNPQAGREHTFGLIPALKKKSVLVAGGGVAGMEAARTAAKRGHTVTLYEGSGRLGGSLIPAGAHDFKKELNELNDWYQKELEKEGVTVYLNAPLTAEEIKAQKPDAVVLALGAVPAVPPVPGIDGANVIDCVTALTQAPHVGQTVAVIGGGLVGCETALGYAQEGKTVTIVEALPDILSAGLPVPESNEQMLRDLLAEAGVAIRTGCRLAKVEAGTVTVTSETGEEAIPADTVVLSVGFRPRPSLAADLAGSGIEVYQVGDGGKVGSVMTAIDTAYTVARSL